MRSGLVIFLLLSLAVATPSPAVAADAIRVTPRLCVLEAQGPLPKAGDRVDDCRHHIRFDVARTEITHYESQPRPWALTLHIAPESQSGLSLFLSRHLLKPAVVLVDRVVILSATILDKRAEAFQIDFETEAEAKRFEATLSGQEHP